MAPTIGLPSGVTVDDALAQLHRILDSELFQRSQRLRRFLQYSVEEGLAGRTANIKEYALAREVFDKPQDFETRSDPIVRVEAGRLRSKIREYYATAGSRDPLFVGIRDRGYLPLIRKRTGAKAPDSGAEEENRPSKPCVAVLAFRDLSLNGNQEPFCAALTNGVLHGLIQVEGLTVIGRTLSRRLDADSDDFLEATRELAVESVVEGSVQRQGDRVRISVELADVRTGRSLWSQSMDRDIDNVLLLQEEVAGSVVEGLRTVLLGRDDVELLASDEDGVPLSKGYAHFVHGKKAWSSGGVKDLKASIDFFELAGRVDADYAQAWAGLANARIALALTRTTPPGSLMREAKAAAYRAIVVDDSLPEAHAAMGIVEALCEFNWSAAEAAFDRARSLAPQLPLIDQWHALAILLPQGKIGEASSRIRHAQRADPTSMLLHYYHGALQYLAGNYQDAATILEVAVELEPEYESAHLMLGDAYFFSGREDAAAEQYDRVMELAESSPSCAKSAKAYAHAVNGRLAEAKKLLKRMLRAAGTGYSWPYEVAIVYAALGEEDTAFEWLERAREDGVPTLTWLQYDPKFAKLRAHPRFVEFLQELGLGSSVSHVGAVTARPAGV